MSEQENKRSSLGCMSVLAIGGILAAGAITCYLGIKINVLRQEIRELEYRMSKEHTTDVSLKDVTGDGIDDVVLNPSSWLPEDRTYWIGIGKNGFERATVRRTDNGLITYLTVGLSEDDDFSRRITGVISGGTIHRSEEHGLNYVKGSNGTIYVVDGELLTKINSTEPMENLEEGK